MASSFRFDVGSLRKPEKMPDGRLRVDGHLTRTGVFEYRNRDGSTRREYRPPEEVFNQDSLNSFAMAPVTNNHPPEDLTSVNMRKYQVGSVGENIRKDDDHVAAPLMICDAETIRDMELGKTQLSCGYTADVIDQPGVTKDGERYDAIQTNIRGNHVAIVSVARAGKTAKIRMDSVVRMDAAEMIEGESEDLSVEPCPGCTARDCQIKDLQDALMMYQAPVSSSKE